MKNIKRLASRPIQFLLNHYSITQGESRSCFFWKIYAEYMAVILVAGFLLSPLNLETRVDHNALRPIVLIINVVLIAPPIETLLFQSLTCMIAYSLKLKPVTQMVVMIAPFALVHFSIAVSTGLRAGCILGFYLAYVYSVQRRCSFRRAFWTTTAFHALSNAIFVSLSLIFDPAAGP